MSKTRDWSTELEELDAQIKGGRIADVQNALRDIEAPTVPEVLRHRFANLCRRVGLAPLGLRILSENVLLDGELRRDALAQDLIEYGVGLQRVGAVREAMGILGGIDAKAYPEADLYLAFGAIVSWDYDAALGWIDSFLARTEENPGDPYRRLVARLNRLECLLITGQHDHLEASATALEAELRAQGHTLLLGNAYEIQAQSRVAKGQFNEALESLASARELIPESNSADSLFISKWQAIARARRDHSIENIQEARSEALQLGHWETLRDLDSQALRIAPTQELACWVYFGTPFASYRRNLERNLQWTPPAETWVTTDVIMSRPAAEGLDIVLEDIGDGRAGLAHRLILLLASDYYRPFRGGEIFARIFADERFNPQTSMNRVHQQIGEARQLITELKWPFRIDEDGGRYSLRWTAPGRLWVRNQELNLDADAVQVAFLRKHFEGRDFATAEAATVMAKSASSARSWLSRAVEKNLLGRYGSGASIRYNFLA
ncbi:MAG: hypothetical protein KF767_01035 [Bdellovibrionaceae bacterium]|nr:hypothetical protein [Pseudobdellovibrionaceae bacterium]